MFPERFLNICFEIKKKTINLLIKGVPESPRCLFAMARKDIFIYGQNWMKPDYSRGRVDGTKVETETVQRSRGDRA